jgi:hypothetical protein
MPEEDAEIGEKVENDHAVCQTKLKVLHVDSRLIAQR